jgi:hypothetical protein
MRIRSNLFALLVVVGACADDTARDKGDESPLPSDADKADTQRKPTDLGAITSGKAVGAALSPTSRYLAWEFDVSAAADVSLDTSKAPAGASVDTVLYLYKQTAAGTWGSYIARNDDAAGSDFSSIDKHVTAGRYRVLVKGYSTTTYGGFLLSYACSGAGCAAAPTCAFGDTFHDIDPARFVIDGPTHLTRTSALSSLEAAQIVRAMHASTHTDVTTAAEAFDAADQGQIDAYQITDTVGVRRFTAFEYGAGDNSYGAIFARGTTTVATEIHDGDLYGCKVTPQVCLFGRQGGDYAVNPALMVGTHTSYGAHSTVAKAVQAEIVASLRAQKPQVGAIEEVWAQIDGGSFRRVDVTHTDGRAFTILEYGLGGLSYGAAFAKGTTTRAVTIENGATVDCNAY